MFSRVWMRMYDSIIIFYYSYRIYIGNFTWRIVAWRVGSHSLTYNSRCLVPPKISIKHSEACLAWVLCSNDLIPCQANPARVLAEGAPLLS